VGFIEVLFERSLRSLDQLIKWNWILPGGDDGINELVLSCFPAKEKNR
jgi:hypothetical protein